MGRGGAEDGRLRPAAGIHPGTRFGLLAAVAAGTLIAAYYVVSNAASFWGAAYWSASFLLAFGVSFLQLRHAAIALLAALIPVCGTLCSTALLQFAGGPVPNAILPTAFGLSLALFLAQDFVFRALGDEPRPRAALHALYGVARPATAAVAGGAFLFLVSGSEGTSGSVALASLVQLVVSSVFASLVLALALPFVTIGEAFIARANRLRESRIVRAYRASMVAVPRWGIAMSGIALVLGVLAVFGMPAAQQAVANWLSPTLLGLIVMLLAAHLVTGSWRDTVALSLSLGLLALFGGLCAWPAPAWGADAWSGMLHLLVVPLLFIVMMANGARRFRDGGEDVSIARLRAVEEMANTIVFVAAAGLGTLLPWIATLNSARPILLLPAGAAIAIAIEPGLATAVETYLPRRRSVADLYSRR